MTQILFSTPYSTPVFGVGDDIEQWDFVYRSAEPSDLGNICRGCGKHFKIVGEPLAERRTARLTTQYHRYPCFSGPFHCLSAVSSLCLLTIQRSAGLDAPKPPAGRPVVPFSIVPDGLIPQASETWLAQVDWRAPVDEYYATIILQSKTAVRERRFAASLRSLDSPLFGLGSFSISPALSTGRGKARQRHAPRRKPPPPPSGAASELLGSPRKRRRTPPPPPITQE